MFIHTCALNEMNVIRQGDITGFDDAEVLDVEETEDTEEKKDSTE